MLTDRQQIFYKRIIELSTDLNSSNDEKKYLLIAVKAIKEGENFKDCIHDLYFYFSVLEYGRNSKGLSPKVKSLFNDLKDTYGFTVKAGNNTNSGWWVTTQKYDSRKVTTPVALKSFITYFIIAVGILVLSLSPILPLIERHFGHAGVVVTIILFLIVMMLFVIVMGKTHDG